MNYIISEEQNQRLVGSILDYIEKSLTPHGGWESPKEYKKELRDNSGEIFIFLEDNDGFPDDSKHMWYSLHDNPNVTLPKVICPLVLIPDEIYAALGGFFGELWKPVFIQWFQNHTNLRVKTVDEFGWGRSNL